MRSSAEASATVFIVDDDECSRRSVAALVQSMQIPTRTFPSAEAFLSVYGNELGCLITDFQMPGMSGMELIREMSIRGYSIPAILVSAFMERSVTDDAKRSGVLAVMEKPYRADELLDAVHAAIQPGRCLATSLVDVDETQETP